MRKLRSKTGLMVLVLLLGAEHFALAQQVPLKQLAPLVNSTILGNGSGATAEPQALVIGVCNGTANALTWSGTAFGCNNIGGGGGAVASVSNSDGTITISPTIGAVVASIALGHANTWSGVQTFGTGDLVINGGSATAGVGTVSSAGVVGSSALTTAIDSAFGTTQGGILYRGASAWALLAPGTSGYFLQTQGSGANPTYAPASGGTGCTAGGSSGNVLYSNGSGGCNADAYANLTNGALTLGTSGTAGSVTMSNATSGTITIQPVAGALGTVTISVPAITDTLVTLTATQTLTNKSISGAEVNSGLVATTYGGSGVSAPTAHSLLQAEGASAFGTIAAATAGNIVVDQGSGVDWASKTVGGDCTLSSAAALTCTKTSGTAFGAFATSSAATSAQVQNGGSTTNAVTPAALSGAQAFQVLTWGTTTNWNTQNGWNASVTLTGSTTTMAAPTNVVAGQTYSLLVVQDSTGGRLVTWASAFDWGTAGTPTLTTGASKTDLVSCISAATASTAAANGLYCVLNKGF